MKMLSSLLLLAGILFIASNIRDEMRGETSVYAPDLHSLSSAPEHVSRRQPKNNFRGAMTYQWFMAFGLTAVGACSVAFCKRQDRFDLLSPDFKYPDEEK